MADHFKRALLLRGGILFQERITSVNTGGHRGNRFEFLKRSGFLSRSRVKARSGRKWDEEGGEGEVGWGGTSRPRGIRIRDPQRAEVVSKRPRELYPPGRGWNKGMRCDMQTNVSIIQRGEPRRPADFIRFLKITPDYRPSNVSSRRILGRF